MSEDLQKSSLENRSEKKSDNQNDDSLPTPKKVKPPKLEDKPFEEFINDYLIPGIIKELENRKISISYITLQNKERPVVGGICWLIEGEIDFGRKFWICFSNNEIRSNKTIVLAERGSLPSLLESFLIDEKKTTLQLLISRFLQRLNGQKWLGSN